MAETRHRVTAKVAAACAAPAPRGRRRALLGWLALGAGFAVAAACGGEDEEGAGSAGDGTGGVVLADTGGAFHEGGSGLSSTVMAAGTGTCTIVPDEEGCVGAAYEPEYTPLDIYVLYDQSGSMCICVDPMRDSGCGGDDCNQIRFDAIEDALARFMTDDESTGIGMALGFFGFDTPGQITCDPAAYEEPAVSWGVLPAHAGSITGAIDAVEPIGETPTDAALAGACVVARERQAAEPSHKVVVLLVTDGHPEAPISCDQLGICCPTMEASTAVTSACLEEAGIETYVLGVGPFLQNLSAIAEAGGTREAYLVQEGEVSDRVLDALNAIRADAVIPCELKIPAPPVGENLDYDQVNVLFADANCEGRTFGRVTEASACGDAEGWYYDDSVSPEHILLCPQSCDRVSVPGGQLVMQLGCDTVVIR